MVCAYEKTHLSVEQCGVPESEREEPDQIGLSCRWVCTQVWELSFLSGKIGVGCLSRAWCIPGSNMGNLGTREVHSQRAVSPLGYIWSWDGVCVHAHMPACIYMGRTSRLMHPSVGDHKDEMIWGREQRAGCVHCGACHGNVCFWRDALSTLPAFPS